MTRQGGLDTNRIDRLNSLCALSLNIVTCSHYPVVGCWCKCVSTWQNKLENFKNQMCHNMIRTKINTQNYYAHSKITLFLILFPKRSTFLFYHTIRKLLKIAHMLTSIAGAAMLQEKLRAQ